MIMSGCDGDHVVFCFYLHLKMSISVFRPAAGKDLITLLINISINPPFATRLIL